MIHEKFPITVDFQTANTRMEFQGGLLSCISFGLTSSLEGIADRAGHAMQFSPLFLWYYRDPYNLNVESMVRALNRVGVCEDKYWPYIVDSDYPYAVANADTTPNSAAFTSAAALNIHDVVLERISGKEEVMRALATGSPILTIRQMGGGIEHCECIIGYNESGMKFHGSGSTVYWEPWESLGLIITQCYKFTKTPWPLVPHPDYIEGDIPTFADGVLTLPVLWNAPQWPASWTRYTNVEVHFEGVHTGGDVKIDDPDIVGYDPLWKPHMNVLTFPKIIINGTTYFKVRVAGPIVRIISYTLD